MRAARQAQSGVLTAGELRRELSARNLAWARVLEHEATYGRVPSVVHAEQDSGGHGNFIAASWRRIQARADWRRRLEKTYTGSSRLARRHDRWRGELECATSSDALLMNVFCYPGQLRRSSLCGLLGLAPGRHAEFGVRANIPLGKGEDRTEIDLIVDDLLIEAKLTETSFQTARRTLVDRYRDLHTVFAVEDLPRTAAGEFDNYQLIRGVLAAYARGARFALLCDGRRHDLMERWFGVMRAVRGYELRSRLQLVTWQEIARESPATLQRFLREKYGIAPE